MRNKSPKSCYGTIPLFLLFVSCSVGCVNSCSNENRQSSEQKKEINIVKNTKSLKTIKSNPDVLAEDKDSGHRNEKAGSEHPVITQMSHILAILEILKSNADDCEKAGEELGSYLQEHMSEISILKQVVLKIKDEMKMSQKEAMKFAESAKEMSRKIKKLQPYMDTFKSRCKSQYDNLREKLKTIQ